MKLAPVLSLLAPLRAFIATLSLGAAFLMHAVLSYHYLATARATAAENLELKSQIRGLVERLADVEESMGQVAAAHRNLNDMTLSEFQNLVSRTGLDTTADGPFSVAVAERADAAGGRTPRPASNSLYTRLLDRMAATRDNAERLAQALGGTAASINHRQEILRSLPSVMPASGWISSDYGVRESPFHAGVNRMHNGIDVAASAGTSIVATADGVVIFAGNHGSYGKLVAVDHGFGISTRYGHNSEILVKRGDRVSRGQPIATIGSTGRSTGLHVHYEVLLHDLAVDPRRFLFEAKPEELQPPPAPLLAANAAMGGESVGADTDEAAPVDPLVQIPSMIGTEWDAPVFAAGSGLALAAAPAVLRGATTGDLAVGIVGLVLLAIASLLMRVPDGEAALEVATDGATSGGRQLTPAELVARYQARQQPTAFWRDQWPDRARQLARRAAARLHALRRS